jgi:hypothetical protein
MHVRERLAGIGIERDSSAVTRDNVDDTPRGIGADPFTNSTRDWGKASRRSVPKIRRRPARSDQAYVRVISEGGSEIQRNHADRVR